MQQRKQILAVTVLTLSALMTTVTAQQTELQEQQTKTPQSKIADNKNPSESDQKKFANFKADLAKLSKLSCQVKSQLINSSSQVVHQHSGQFDYKAGRFRYEVTVLSGYKNASKYKEIWLYDGKHTYHYNGKTQKTTKKVGVHFNGVSITPLLQILLNQQPKALKKAVATSISNDTQTFKCAGPDVGVSTENHEFTFNNKGHLTSIQWYLAPATDSSKYVIWRSVTLTTNKSDPKKETLFEWTQPKDDSNNQNKSD